MPEIDISDEGAGQTAPTNEPESSGELTTASTTQRLNRRWIAAAVVFALVLAGGGAWGFLHKDDLGDNVAFRAFGQDVTKADVTKQSSTLHALYGVEKPTSDKELAKYWRDLAKSMALARVVDHAAQQLKISVPASSSQSALSEYIKQYYGDGAQGQSAFIAALGNEGTSEPEVLKELTRQLLVSRVYDDITKSVQAPSAEEVAAAYKTRSCELRVPEQRHLLNIVTVTRSQAVQALNKIKAGRSFSSVAKTYSADQSTSSSGGDLGLVSKDQLETAYGAAAFTAKAGQLFGPVQTRYGWNVGQVAKIEPALVPTQEKSQAALSEILLTEAKSKVWQGWIHDQLKNADVRYADSYKPSDPYSAPDPVNTTSKAGCS